MSRVPVMPRNKKSSFQWDGLTRATPAILTAALLMAVSPATAADALNFFNNWFITGDYAVAGVGLSGKGASGWATGIINMTGVPIQAQPVAAFLYWSTAESSAVPALTDGYFNGKQIRGVVLGSPANPGCSSSAGTTSAGRWAHVYRADVLRYLPVDKNNVRQANGAQTVKLPDSTNGTTLVVIYRVVLPGLPLAVPLRSVVIYDGAFTMANNYNSAGMTQTVAGFYQASASDDAKITHIVANGQPSVGSPLSVNGTPLSTLPFVGAQGSRWDNPTFEFTLRANAASFATKVTPNSQTCLTWGAIVASMRVQDSDFDGLLDTWELHGLHRNTQVSPATFGGCSDYPNEQCENLPAMGAVNGKRDIFLQIDWMNGTGDGKGGADGRGTHDHIPKLEALRDVAAAFAGALPGALGIALHFDVGNNYQVPALPYIVPAAYARGGSDLDESTLKCNDTAKHKCDYQVPYPVLSFKYGLASVRDGNSLLGIKPHFAQDRKDIFRYALFAHALGGPYTVSGAPLDPITLLPTTVPASYSGIADRPGADFMVTLGLWRSQDPANDQVGSAQVQKGTLMHELGHSLGLGHGGLSSQPNCMPNYQSVMNYLYQTRGLTDAKNVNVKHIDYSYGLALGDLNENLLNAPRFFPPRYRVRYFGPLGPGALPGSEAKLHCDGTQITGGPKAVRSEGSAASWPDWSNGTVKLGSPFAFDVNFNGVSGESFDDQPDWFSLNLQQIGSRSNFGALSVGALATDGGALATDAGALATDGGVFATDGGAFATDGGALATDGGVFATDGGALATDGGAFATDAGEFTADNQAASGLEPPSALTATNELSDIKLTWLPPADGAVQTYDIFRCAGTGCTPAAPAFRSGISGTTPMFIDSVSDSVDAGGTCPAASTCYNTSYTYAVVANALVLNTVTPSPFSNTASSEVTHLFVIADSKTVTYDGTVQPVTFQIYGDVAGSLTAGVSCTTSPVPARNWVAGGYTITCDGPKVVGASLTDGVSYNAPYLTHTPGALTINKRPITLTPVTDSKTYDGSTSSKLSPTVTGGLGLGDTAAQAFDSRNAGPRTLIASGVVNDGNGGNNYSVTVGSPVAGTINALPITVTPVADSKTYDGTTTSTKSPTITPGVISPDTSGFTQAFDSPNAGARTLIASGSVNDGNSGKNYAITIAAPVAGTIASAPVTAKAGSYSGTYDGAAHSPAPACAVTGTYTGSLICTNSPSSVGPDAGSGMVIPVPSGDTLSNFAITPVNGAWTIAPANTTTNITSETPDPSLAGQAVHVTVTVSSSSITPDGTVTVSADSGAQSCIVNLSGGTGTCDLTFATTGSKLITAAYTGTVNFNTSTSASTPHSVTVYTSDTTLADFTSGIATYATFLNIAGLGGDNYYLSRLPYAPIASDVLAGYRIFANGSNPPIDVMFPSAVSKIRVFVNIDHPGAAYDGYQYTISGSNDGSNFTPLFDATSVSNSGEPFTLASFTGTAPFRVNNVFPVSQTSPNGIGPSGTVGYEADFSFSAAYRYYRFGASTVAVVQGNTDQELTAVAQLP